MAEDGGVSVDVQARGTGSLSFTLAGPDAGLFSISSSGLLTAPQRFDFESPADADQDNVYQVTVTVSDASTNLSATRTFTITVTDVDTDALVKLTGTILGDLWGWTLDYTPQLPRTPSSPSNGNYVLIAPFKGSDDSPAYGALVDAPQLLGDGPKIFDLNNLPGRIGSTFSNAETFDDPSNAWGYDPAMFVLEASPETGLVPRLVIAYQQPTASGGSPSYASFNTKRFNIRPAISDPLVAGSTNLSAPAQAGVFQKTQSKRFGLSPMVDTDTVPGDIPLDADGDGVFELVRQSGGGFRVVPSQTLFDEDTTSFLSTDDEGELGNVLTITGVTAASRIPSFLNVGGDDLALAKDHTISIVSLRPVLSGDTNADDLAVDERRDLTITDLPSGPIVDLQVPAISHATYRDVLFRIGTEDSFFTRDPSGDVYYVPSTGLESASRSGTLEELGGKVLRLPEEVGPIVPTGVVSLDDDDLFEVVLGGLERAYVVRGSAISNAPGLVINIESLPADDWFVLERKKPTDTPDGFDSLFRLARRSVTALDVNTPQNDVVGLFVSSEHNVIPPGGGRFGALGAVYFMPKSMIDEAWSSGEPIDLSSIDDLPVTTR